MKSIFRRRLCLLIFAAVVLAAGAQLLFVTATHADPVWGELFTIKQPDGTNVQVRIWGDEFYRVVESLDGYTLVRDPNSDEICYARLSSDGNSFVSTGIRFDSAKGEALGLVQHLRVNPAARRAIIQQKRSQKLEDERELLSGPDMPQRVEPPCNGDVEGICLIIDFSDEVATIPAADIDDYCNQVGYTGYGNNGSVRDYFYDVSDGNLTYTNYVPASYFRAPNTKAYYDDCYAPYGQRAREMITAALNNLNASGFDFSQYDANGDDYIDAINCFYAGVTGCSWANGLWPHSGGISWFADGVYAYRYQVTGLGSALRLSTFCHENGHMICFWPDLYDYDHDSSGVGRFCIMCAYTSSTNPQEPCAYLKYIAGWTTTTLLTMPQTGLTVPSTSNTIYKFEHPVYSNEYYLVENRQQAGRDSGLPDAGIAIWHIDENGSNSDQDMTPSLHYEATLVQADGDWDLENYVNNGDATDLWSSPGYVECSPSTDPNTDWWAGDQSYLRIAGISTSSSLMTFDFDLSPDADFSADVTMGCAPLTVNFTDLSRGTILTWHWNFGDGDTSIVQNPSHQYAAPGDYTVSLTVTAAAGSGTITKIDYITVPVGGVCQIDPPALDFGSVDLLDSADMSFTISNVGCDTLVGSVSELCTPYSIVSGSGPYSLAVTESLTVTVRFSPTLIGTFNCSIETGSGLCADVLCAGTGALPPPTCQIDPDTLDFGNVDVGGFGMLSFDITNVGYGLLSGTVSESCDDNSLASLANYNLTHDQSHTVNIIFFPGSPGTKECLIETGNADCVDVFCTGVGDSPATCLVDPDTLVYGTVYVGDYSDDTFIITNTGGDVLTGTVSESCGEYSIISGGGPYSLSAAESLVVTVRFEPTTSGTKECTIETGDALCTDVFCAGVGGTPPICVVDTDSLHFGTVTEYDSLDLAFYIANTGGGILSGTVADTCSHFDVVAGGGPYALNNGDTVRVTVRFKPDGAGTFECTIPTGADCADVYCEGIGELEGTGIHARTPGKLTLYQNYPNPFNPSTTIAFWLPQKERVVLLIYDVEGALIRALANEVLDEGFNEYPWDGRDSNGNHVSSGVYFYQLKAGAKALTKKMVLLK